MVAWLPGTEGGGVADAVYWKKKTYKESYLSLWPKNMEDIPCNP